MGICPAARVAIGFALLVLLPAGQMHASGGQWTSVTLSDLAGTPDLSRRDPHTLNMRTAGDFDGDGVLDRAYVLINRTSSEYRILACLSRVRVPCEEQTVRTGPLAHLATLGISTTNRARLGEDFAQTDEGEALIARMRQSNAPDFLHVFAFEASNAVYLLTSKGFEAVQVTD